MNGEGVCYPAFLLGVPGYKPRAFNGPDALFISGRFRPPVGPMDEDTLVDSLGRSWTLRSIAAVGRWGTWKERLLLWWRRRYRVEFDAAEGTGMSLDELKAYLLERGDASEASLKADPDVSEEVRQYYLDVFGRAQEALVAAETFEGVADVMGPSRLYADNWFSGRGRANRAEYLAVVGFAIVMTGMAGLVGSLFASPIWSFADFALRIGTLWLIGAAVVRRFHDFGWRFFPVLMLWLAIAVVEQAVSEYLHLQGGWLSAALLVLLILVVTIPPGTPGENRFDPQPNPGPSL